MGFPFSTSDRYNDPLAGFTLSTRSQGHETSVFSKQGRIGVGFWMLGTLRAFTKWRLREERRAAGTGT